MLGLITCFFDDHDEPLTITSPLFEGDAMLEDVSLLLCQETFDVHMFDGNDRELFATRACVHDAERLRTTFERSVFPALDIDRIPALLKAIGMWFGRRTPVDDAASFAVRFTEHLMPPDIGIIDLSDGDHDFRDIGHGLVVDSLERPNPGPLQERDIAALLRQVFGRDAALLNPLRADTGKELTDVLVVTSDLILLVQAKDSPNTEAALNRSIVRKRSTIRSHIEKGARQLQGALQFVMSGEATIRRGDAIVAIEIGARALRGALVVRELFEDDYKASSAPVLKVIQQTRVPCVLLDYAGMLAMASNLSTSEELINGFDRLHGVAVQHGEFPKPRFLPTSDQ
ncbi:hypothetical protein [Bradyrhizobium sp. CCBAU 21362]|uniref:hypothetical protein n=1 Tax=Bradyrhizobium sp. CCBAU 21362 TaxID=1325082 RepID=UPI0023059A11|nr:hypothetical protein [Bradyrhizobium sp. CCBAU 21362]